MVKPIEFDINQETRLVSDGDDVLLFAPVKTQRLSLDALLTMRDACNAILMLSGHNEMVITTKTTTAVPRQGAGG